jgi:hypothetical protein
MLGSPAVKVTPIALPGIRVVWPRLLALRLDLLAIVEGRDLLMVFTLENTGPKLRHIRSLGYRPSTLSLSPSRAFLLLGNGTGNWFEVRDTKTDHPATEVGGPDAFSATFAALDGVDVLVSAGDFQQVEHHLLESLDLTAEQIDGLIRHWRQGGPAVPEHFDRIDHGGQR